MHRGHEPVLQLDLPLRRTSARTLRTRLRDHLATRGLPRKIIDEVLLAADEAYVNAFMHSGQVEGVVEVRAQVRDDRLLLEIRDRGCGFEADAVDVRSQPDPLLTHGRGLFLIYHLMDEVEVQSYGSGDGTQVRMAKEFSPRRPRVAKAS